MMNRDQNQPNQQNQQAAGGLDPEVQQVLNPDVRRLDPNDANVAKDPVCGMLVDKRTAANTLAPSVNSTMPTLYFCSANCKKLFEENPARYGYQDL